MTSKNKLVEVTLEDAFNIGVSEGERAILKELSELGSDDIEFIQKYIRMRLKTLTSYESRQLFTK